MTQREAWQVAMLPGAPERRTHGGGEQPQTMRKFGRRIRTGPSRAAALPPFTTGPLRTADARPGRRDRDVAV